MIKAILSGIAVILIIDIAWLISFSSEAISNVLVLIMQASPLIIGLISSALAPRKKIILGTFMAIPTTISCIAVNVAFEVLGKSVDFSGFTGTLALTFLTLAYAVPMCAIGASIGVFVSNWFRKRIDHKRQVP